MHSVPPATVSSPDYQVDSRFNCQVKGQFCVWECGAATALCKDLCRILEAKRRGVKREEKTRKCHNIVTPVAPAYCFNILCRSEVVVLYNYLSMDSINK